MAAVVWVGAEEVVELGDPVGQPIPVVELCHGQLIVIRKKDALGEHAQDFNRGSKLR